MKKKIALLLAFTALVAVILSGCSAPNGPAIVPHNTTFSSQESSIFSEVEMSSSLLEESSEALASSSESSVDEESSQAEEKQQSKKQTGSKGESSKRATVSEKPATESSKAQEASKVEPIKEESSRSIEEKKEPTSEAEQPNPEPTFDVKRYVSLAKNYGTSVGLTLLSDATSCWDTPILATANSKNLERDIKSRLDWYAGNPDINYFWVWSESLGDGRYNLVIAYA